MPKTSAPQPDPGLPYRHPLLAVFKAQPERRFSIPGLLAQVQTLIPDAPQKGVEEALKWHFKKGNATFEHDDTLELDVWFLTTRGKELK